MWKFALKFAVVGIVIGAAISLLWLSVQIFDPFHLPIVGHAPPNYKQPPLAQLIDDGVFVLCPGTLLQVFTLDIGGWVPWIMWIFAVLLNGPIYFVLGLLVGTLLKREGTRGSDVQGA
jgi:hypothetical protein